MKNSVKVSFLNMLAVLISSSTFADVTVDYDKTLDFSTYKTFGFAGSQRSMY